MKNRNGVLETTLDNILTYKCWYIVYNLIIILRFVSILFLVYAMYCIWSISKLFLRTTSFHLANTAWSRPVRRESSPSPAGVDGARRSSLLLLLLAHGNHCYTCSSQGAFMFHFFADYLQFLDQDNYVALNKWDSFLFLMNWYWIKK